MVGGTALEGLGNPKGPSRVLRPKYYNINCIWALKPPYLGPWTLRVRLTRQSGRSDLLQRLRVYSARVRVEGFPHGLGFRV